MTNPQSSIFIHPTAEVQTSKIGINTFVWQFAIVLKGAVIGENCNINSHTFIENDVNIGNNVTVKCGVYLWDGMVVEDFVFIGPNATFVNDIYPRSKLYPEKFKGSILRKGCSVGANATILGGITVGSYALIGAGSVVTKNVPDNSIQTGNPAKIVGWVNNEGKKLIKRNNSLYIDELTGQKYIVKNNTILKLID